MEPVSPATARMPRRALLRSRSPSPFWRRATLRGRWGACRFSTPRRCPSPQYTRMHREHLRQCSGRRTSRCRQARERTSTRVRACRPSGSNRTIASGKRRAGEMVHGNYGAKLPVNHRANPLIQSGVQPAHSARVRDERATADTDAIKFATLHARRLQPQKAIRPTSPPRKGR